ncbi:head GIN domain-containing protein [Lutimonas sp.]|uniref:head GIN domain-containing protein n=1 Tax=Lutimonas sp. TaxID=1872403 RepID=UPI003D9AFC9B
MKRVLFALLLVTSFGFAQEKVTMNLGDFHSLKTYRGLQVELIKSDEAKVIIDGNRSSEVTVKNSNGILRISMSITHTFSADDVMVYLYFKDEIQLIDANEGSHIYSDEVFKQTKITLKAQEAGHIKLELDTDDLEVSSVTGGEVKVEGTSKNQKVKTNTGGMYKGARLDSETADVSANTGGLADVKATKLIDASASTGGIVSIKGEPEELKKSESLGGYVRQ